MEADTDMACAQWNRDLPEPLSREAWETVHIRSNASSRNVNVQEHCYKLKALWHKTPATLNKCFSNVSAGCWRCKSDVGDMMHIWWSCPLIQTYWSKVHKTICKVTGYQVEFSPSLYLLQLPPGNSKISRKALSIQLITAARMLVLVHWKSVNIPTLDKWFRRVEKI